MNRIDFEVSEMFNMKIVTNIQLYIKKSFFLSQLTKFYLFLNVIKLICLVIEFV